MGGYYVDENGDIRDPTRFYTNRESRAQIRYQQIMKSFYDDVDNADALAGAIISLFDLRPWLRMQGWATVFSNVVKVYPWLIEREAAKTTNWSWAVSCAKAITNTLEEEDARRTR